MNVTAGSANGSWRSKVDAGAVRPAFPSLYPATIAVSYTLFVLFTSGASPYAGVRAILVVPDTAHVWDGPSIFDAVPVDVGG
jgi:hypothetical protein